MLIPSLFWIAFVLKMDRLGSCCVDEDASVKHLYMFYYSSKQHFWQSSFVRIWRSDIF